MHILCTIGTQGGAEIIHRLLEVIRPEHDLHLLHIIDTGPRRTMQDYLFGPGQLHRTPPPERIKPLDAAEQAAGEAAVEKGRREAEKDGFRVQTEIRRGKPEQIIIRAAQLGNCHLIVIQASEGAEGRPKIGPESIGHTARFVLDYAPCDVLFLGDSL
jgi:nucleotide-binding universal stress UspA family protein